VMRLLVVIILMGMVGCASEAKPLANLTFSVIQKAPAGYTIEFYSDIEIDSLFASESTRKIVSRQLICALENDRNFSVEHKITRFFSGDVELQKTDSDNSDRGYRYLSNGLFYLSFNNGSRLAKLTEREVINLLSVQDELECKVVMTVFLSKPYYSAAMKIPVAQVVKLLRENKS